MTQADPGNPSTDGSRNLPTNWTPDISALGARLALIRWQMGWNMLEAARECGIPPQSWRTWELDGTSPREIVTIARQIADRTGVDYLWLLLGEQGSQTGQVGVAA